MGKESKTIVFGRKKGDIHALHRLKLFESMHEKRLQKAIAKNEREVETFKKKSLEKIGAEKEAEEKMIQAAVEEARKEAGKEAEEISAGYKKEEKVLQKLLEKNKRRALTKAESILLEA